MWKWLNKLRSACSQTYKGSYAETQQFTPENTFLCQIKVPF